MNPHRRLYAGLLAQATKYALFELDQVLSGKAEGCLFRLAPGALERARSAIRELYAVAGSAPELVPTGLAAARADAQLQRFLARAQGTPPSNPERRTP